MVPKLRPCDVSLRYRWQMKIVDAVTVALLQDGDLLMTHRLPEMTAFGGYFAFPGGKVDAEDDLTPPAALERKLPDVAPRLLRALARECAEELAIDLDALADAGEIIELIDLGTALTPPIAERRFNTHFFKLVLRNRPTLVVDPREASDARWAPPAEWLKRYNQGRLLVAPPTRATVRALGASVDATHVPDLGAGSHDDDKGARLIEPLAGVRILPVRSHTLPPAHHTNAFVLGDMQSHRILVDPSPASDDDLEMLVARVADIGVHEVFITHHHPDHWERADTVATRLGATVGMSAETRRRIRGSHPDAFADIEIHEYREGDVVCRWQGEEVKVIEVPGHDPGQLALMPESRQWCLVSDLIQGIGTVVIPEDGGNMADYFASMQRVIDLDPAVVLPSHGMAMGGTYRIKATLDHRKQREAQILALSEQGQSVAEMLPQLYVGLDPRLEPLAAMNIRMHLNKLRDEGRLAA